MIKYKLSIPGEFRVNEFLFQKSLGLLISKRCFVHYYSPHHQLFILQKSNVLIIYHNKTKHAFKIRERFPKNIFGKSILLSRLLRLNQLVVSFNETTATVVIFNDFKVYTFSLLQNILKKIDKTFPSRTPLYNGVCNIGRFHYFGDYGNNGALRTPVGLYKLDTSCLVLDKANLDIYHKAKHIHSVTSHDNSLIVCTGDTDEESSILKFSTDLEFLDTFCSGSQTARAVNVVPCGDHFYWGMDSPLQPSYLIKYDIGSKTTSHVYNASNPIWFMRKTGQDIFFTTSVEPSTRKMLPEVSINVVKRGETFKLAYFAKDWLPYIFKYGAIFPSGGSDKDPIIWNLQAVRML